MGGGKRKYEELVKEGRGPRVPRFKWFQGSKDQDISKSHSNMSLTLKKVHLVQLFVPALYMPSWANHYLAISRTPLLQQPCIHVLCLWMK